MGLVCRLRRCRFGSLFLSFPDKIAAAVAVPRARARRTDGRGTRGDTHAHAAAAARVTAAIRHIPFLCRRCQRFEGPTHILHLIPVISHFTFL